MTVEETASHLAALESFVKGKSTSEDFETSLRCIFENEHAVSTHKRCLAVVLGLLGTHIDHALMVYILEHLPVLTAMLSKYPMLQKEYVKALVTLTFSSTAPGIRPQSLRCPGEFQQKVYQADTGHPEASISSILKDLPLGNSPHLADAEPFDEQPGGAFCCQSKGLACLHTKVTKGPGFPSQGRPETSQHLRPSKPCSPGNGLLPCGSLQGTW